MWSKVAPKLPPSPIHHLLSHLIPPPPSPPPIPPPSQATGKVMGAELPHLPGGSDSVLFPASIKASGDLQESLAASGFSVTRMSTYNTVRDTEAEGQGREAGGGLKRE